MARVVVKKPIELVSFFDFVTTVEPPVRLEFAEYFGKQDRLGVLVTRNYLWQFCDHELRLGNRSVLWFERGLQRTIYLTVVRFLLPLVLRLWSF